MSHFSKQSYNGSAKKLNLYHDDTFFEIIKKYLTPTQQKISQDFLDIFYYLIVCYSKVCFKRYANWRHHNSQWKQSNKTPFKTQSIFDYELANETRSHELLLSIQYKMFKYRKTFATNRESLSELITPEFIVEYNIFTKDSLTKFADIIIKPVRIVRANILELLEKYSEIPKEGEQPNKKSRYINYDALQRVLTT